MNRFTTIIHRWYSSNKRDLPWRETKNPYKIWISEIILQQTRIDQGIPYYHKFIENFPDVHQLAKASEDEVLKNWQGLGYYTRARNLHSTACYISKELNGKFPRSYDQILRLKGVGPYTAAAIASIAFGHSYPAVDGNVCRLLARYYGISTPLNSEKGKKEFRKLAAEHLPDNNPGLHNQAMMEFGALQCTPQQPDCPNCPLARTCLAFTNQMVGQLPVKIKKGTQRKRYFHYFFIENQNYTWLEKRSGKDIWKNLYQFPLVETEKELSAETILSLNQPSFLNGCKSNVRQISTYRKHILSHQIIYARLIFIEIDKNCLPETPFFRIRKNEIANFAVPRLIEILLTENRDL